MDIPESEVSSETEVSTESETEVYQYLPSFDDFVAENGLIYSKDHYEEYVEELKDSEEPILDNKDLLEKLRVIYLNSFELKELRYFFEEHYRAKGNGVKQIDYLFATINEIRREMIAVFPEFVPGNKTKSATKR